MVGGRFRLLTALIISFVLTAWNSAAIAQPASFTLYLTGDGGDAYSVDGTPALAMLRDSLAACDGSCGVLFMGDNIYESGLAPEGHPDRARGEQILDAQIEVARLASGPAVFLPGNHDSGGRGVGGDLRRLEEMERYLVRHLGDRAFLPRGGEPGPIVLHPHPSVALIIINSQWWFEADHRGERTGRLPTYSRRHVVAQIDRFIEANRDRHVVLATHHPVRSAGDHALYWESGLTITGLLKRVLGGPQDYSERAYQRFRHDVLSLAERHPDLIVVSGHEHNLTYFDAPGHHIVSGSLSRPEWASYRSGATFASGAPGFGVLRFTALGHAHLSFSALDQEGDRQMLFERMLGRVNPASDAAAEDLLPESDGFAVPPPSFEVHAAPTYSEWHGPGASAYVRYTVPETRIRPRLIAEAGGRYDHGIHGVRLHAGVHHEGAATASGLMATFAGAGRTEGLWGADLDHPVRHFGLTVEPYAARFAYDRLLRLTMAAAARYHRTEAARPSDVPFPLDLHAIPSVMLRLGIRVNTLDSEVVPEGGIDAHADIRGIIYDDRQAALRLESGFRFMRSFGFTGPLTAALGTHAMMITGDPPFFDAANTSGVRGYAPLGWTGRGAVMSSLELRQTLLHLDRRRIRPAGVLAFVDVGVLFPIPRPYGPPQTTRNGSQPMSSSDPLVNSSAGAGVWANVSRRVVMNAAIGSTGGDGVFVSLGPAFHF